VTKERLAQLGYAALVVDPRYRGESGGEPRCYENPAAKVEDLRAAVSFLSDRPASIPTGLRGWARRRPRRRRATRTR
jgi:fermentation-respiration switch protein FrsA (DUF1100 family)